MKEVNRVLPLPSATSFLILGLICQSCSLLVVPRTLITSVPTWPTRAFQTPPQGIVVTNAYDVNAASFRNSKEKLFTELIDFTARYTANEIKRRSEIPSSLAEGRVLPSLSDSSLQTLLAANSASHAILINSFNAYFEKTHVDVTTTENGKNRVAYYDVIVDVGYSFRNGLGLRFDTLISVRKFHSSREVISGLLAAGPSIVSNPQDAEEGIQVNVDRYLKSFFKGTENRRRSIYATNEFKEVGAAIDRGGYEEAIVLSEKLIASTTKKTSAMAGYNCAVLLEYLERYEKVKYYLEESIHTFALPEAQAMIQDYRLYRARQ